MLREMITVKSRAIQAELILEAALSETPSEVAANFRELLMSQGICTKIRRTNPVTLDQITVILGELAQNFSTVVSLVKALKHLRAETPGRKAQLSAEHGTDLSVVASDGHLEIRIKSRSRRKDK